MNKPLIAVALIPGAIILGSLSATAQQFPLRGGDMVVMLGDSITRQHLHSNYIELYCLTRFPSWKLRFRNSGVGGDTIPRAAARLQWDALAWKPTVMTIELGMNDAGGGPEHVPTYTDQMKALVLTIRRAGVRPILLTASPVNDGTTSGKLAGRNLTLDQMANGAVKLARQDGLPYADQFHALLDLWARNLAARGVNLEGDAVHPGPPGQLTMAWACLRGLGAPSLVSAAVLDATQGQVIEAQGCQIRGIKPMENGISFVRTDEATPWPIPENARPALGLVPIMDDLNQFVLGVRGLPAGDYEVKIDGATVGVVPAPALAGGWNMGTPTAGPIWIQCLDAMKYVDIKSQIVTGWRGVSGFEIPDWLAGLGVEQRKAEELQRREEQIKELDGQIWDACQPRPHRWEVVRVG